jgi:hypothetical protein
VTWIQACRTGPCARRAGIGTDEEDNELLVALGAETGPFVPDLPTSRPAASRRASAARALHPFTWSGLTSPAASTNEHTEPTEVRVIQCLKTSQIVSGAAGLRRPPEPHTASAAARSKTAGERRQAPQQHLLGAGQRVGPADRRTRRLLLFQRGAAALVRSRNR